MLIERPQGMSQGTVGEPPVEQCDVLDKSGLSKYRALRAKWLGWIQTDPNHSIWNQIFAMISNDLAVQTISYAAQNDAESPLHNQLLARTILQGHQDAQILGIRRLIDKRPDVVSLGRLLNEIKDNLNVFTREIYVSGDGQPYDNTALPGLWSKATHSRFDRLSLVASDQRKRTDRISKSLIDHLVDHIRKSGARDVVKWSHQFVAHAGDAQTAQWRDLEVTFEKVASAQRSIAQVVQLISWQLLQAPALGPLVPAEHSPFAHFDRLVNSEALEMARQRRDEIEKDRNSWLHNDWGSTDLLTLIGWPNPPGP
jgi:hypothetical protein